MKILVTGGAGYIGSVLVGELLKNDYEVVVIDNFMYRQVSLLGFCHYKNLTVIRGDARDKRVLKKYIAKAEAIFPLACLTGAPICSKDEVGARTVNLEAIETLIEMRSKDQMIIFPTTNSGYGIGQKDRYCTEQTPLNPISHYGKLKVEAEKIVLEAGNSITLRLATAFGVSPRMRLDLLVNDFVYRALTDHFLVLFEPHFKRNYIHVRDVSKAFIHCVQRFSQMKNESYNVGLSDANISKWELCEEIKKRLPDFYFAEATIGEDLDKRDYIVSNEKIEKTGFKPNISLQAGIEELIKGYQIIRRSEFSNV